MAPPSNGNNGGLGRSGQDDVAWQKYAGVLPGNQAWYDFLNDIRDRMQAIVATVTAQRNQSSPRGVLRVFGAANVDAKSVGVQPIVTLPAAEAPMHVLFVRLRCIATSVGVNTFRMRVLAVQGGAVRVLFMDQGPVKAATLNSAWQINTNNTVAQMLFPGETLSIEVTTASAGAVHILRATVSGYQEP